MSEMKIAIILPVYNAGHLVESAINSVINQSYNNWILYIRDDCSTDNTLDIISRYASENIIIQCNSRNSGAAATRNSILETVNQEVIAFIDADDVWEVNKLELQNNRILLGEKLIVSHYFYKNGNDRKIVSFHSKNLNIDDFLKKRFRVCFSSLLYRKMNGSECLRFIDRGHEDYYFIYQLMKCLGNIDIIAEPLVTYNVVGDSLSSDKGKATRWHYNILKIIFPHNPLKRINYFFYYIFNALLFRVKK